MHVVYVIMGAASLYITCTCHQAKITICCQMPLVAPIAQKICTDRGVYQHAEYKFAVRGNQTCSQTTSGIQSLNIIIIASLQLFSWLWIMLSLIVTNTQTDVIMQLGIHAAFSQAM